jgi:hypothetical protein
MQKSVQRHTERRPRTGDAARFLEVRRVFPQAVRRFSVKGEHDHRARGKQAALGAQSVLGVLERLDVGLRPDHTACDTIAPFRDARMQTHPPPATACGAHAHFAGNFLALTVCERPEEFLRRRQVLLMAKSQPRIRLGPQQVVGLPVAEHRAPRPAETNVA